MKQVILSILLAIFFTPVIAETVHKKVNPDGSIEFTDRESKDSKEVVIPPTIIVPSQPPINLSTPPRKTEPVMSHVISLLSPANNETINQSADVKIEVSVEPKLKGHFQIRYSLNDQSAITKNLTHTFSNVNRGLHSVSVEVLNFNEEPVSRKVSHQIHMKRFFKKKKP